MNTFFINENDSGQRIDKFISKAMPDLPKSMMYRLIRKKDIKINGKRCEISSKLQTGDTVTVYTKETLSAEKKHDMSFLESRPDPDVIYEDNNIIIVNKPVGLDSHSNGSHMTETLIDQIKHYLYDKNEYIPENESSFAPALCSRLDRNTCGLVTAAKNAAALREMNKAIKDGNLTKVYHCAVIGKLPRSEDIITAYHKKDESRNLVRIVDSPVDGYKEIKTGYKVLAVKNDISLVEVNLFTGRTHQIRAHLSHIGNPVLGDGKYGVVSFNKKYNIFRQALCAYSLSFYFPHESELSYLDNLAFKAPVPEFEKKLF